MARQSPEGRKAEQRGRDLIEDAVRSHEEPDGDSASENGSAPKSGSTPEDEAAGAVARVTADDRSLWAEVRIDPVEIALPAGTGYTLRAYRPVNTLTPTVVADREDDDLFARRPDVSDDEEVIVILDEEFNAAATEDEREAEAPQGTDESDQSDESKEAEEESTEEDEEVPIFLSHRGRLLLFRSTESLVDFVRSGEPHDLAQLDTWPQLVDRIEPADVAPRDDDTYELDLVVENLRGGHDTWDVRLLTAAGEIARDLGYALRLEPLITALAPGSPLDDLDEALRKTEAGGVGGFFGRRRLRKIGAQQATLGWRTIIGKISAVVHWRD